MGTKISWSPWILVTHEDRPRNNGPPINGPPNQFTGRFGPTGGFGPTGRYDLPDRFGAPGYGPPAGFGGPAPNLVQLQTPYFVCECDVIGNMLLEEEQPQGYDSEDSDTMRMGRHTLWMH